MTRCSLPERWPSEAVGNLFQIQLGKMLSKKSKAGTSPFPYLANRHVQWGRVDLDELEWMDFDDREREKFILRPGDLLVCEGGEVGRTAIWRGELENCYFQKAVHRLRPKDGRVLPDYMYRFMEHAAKQGLFKQLTSQTSIAHLTKEKLAILEIPLPPLPEQRRIAAILDKADAIRRKRQETIRLTEQFLRSAFLDMFGDPVTNPKGWPRGTMSDVIADTQYGTSARANTEPLGLPVLRMNNITYTGELNLTDLKWCAIEVSDRQKYAVRNGDLLFNRTNSPKLVGKTAVWDRDDQFAYAGYLVRVRFRAGTRAEYISAWLNSQFGKSYLFEKAKPSNNMSNFSASLFRTIPVLLPPADLQARFASTVRRIGMMKGRLHQLHATTEELSRSLTQRAFAGEF